MTPTPPPVTTRHHPPTPDIVNADTIDAFDDTTSSLIQ
jgi:hypothetical protein